jgi:predicted transcriptional regulator
MTTGELIASVEAKVLCGSEHLEVEFGVASDLLSDVLTVTADRVLFLTGLATTQSIRTAIVSDISAVLIVRGKRATPDMIELAEENDITLIESPFSMFRAAAVLYEAGLKAVY